MSQPDTFRGEITAKKLINSKLFYYLQTDTFSKWMEFQQLGDYIEEVIEFEKEWKEGKKVEADGERRKKSKKSEMEEEVPVNSDESRSLVPSSSPIHNIIFMEQKGKLLLFKVWHEDGTTSVRSNLDLRQTHKDLLLDFYQNNVAVSWE